MQPPYHHYPMLDAYSHSIGHNYFN